MGARGSRWRPDSCVTLLLKALRSASGVWGFLAGGFRLGFRLWAFGLYARGFRLSQSGGWWARWGLGGFGRFRSWRGGLGRLASCRRRRGATLTIAPCTADEAAPASATTQIPSPINIPVPSRPAQNLDPTMTVMAAGHQMIACPMIPSPWRIACQQTNACQQMTGRPRKLDSAMTVCLLPTVCSQMTVCLLVMACPLVLAGFAKLDGSLGGWGAFGRGLSLWTAIRIRSISQDDSTKTYARESSASVPSPSCAMLVCAMGSCVWVAWRGRVGVGVGVGIGVGIGVGVGVGVLV